jgi:7-cyano-7-deazaguanine reductase
MKELDLPLGRDTVYPAAFAPEVLRAIPRAPAAPGCHGADYWTAHEHGWLDLAGRPACGVLELRIPADSPAFVESKSLKLYLGSYAMSHWRDGAAVEAQVAQDVGSTCGVAVDVRLRTLDEHAALPRVRDAELGTCIDAEEVAFDASATRGVLPTVLANETIVAQVLYSHLLRSLCPVTGQPDHATLVLQYRGRALDRGRLLQYILGFRNEACFHERLIERIHADVLAHCAPASLTVSGLFCRRGGIDIVPVRSTEPTHARPPRTARQ